MASKWSVFLDEQNMQTVQLSHFLMETFLVAKRLNTFDCHFHVWDEFAKIDRIISAIFGQNFANGQLTKFSLLTGFYATSWDDLFTILFASMKLIN